MTPIPIPIFAPEVMDLELGVWVGVVVAAVGLAVGEGLEFDVVGVVGFGGGDVLELLRRLQTNLVSWNVSI